MIHMNPLVEADYGSRRRSGSLNLTKAVPNQSATRLWSVASTVGRYWMLVGESQHESTSVIRV